MNKLFFENFAKNEFGHLSSVYLNSAYFGPSPQRSLDLVNEAMKKELDPSFYPYSEWISIPEELRILIAQILKVSPSTITHSTSTTDIISTVANGLELGTKDEVCSLDGDYPSNILPWMMAEKRKAFRFKKLPAHPLPDVDYLKKYLSPQTKVFNMSYVSFDTGRKIDLLSMGKFLRERNILFVLDITQGLGAVSLSPEEIEHVDVMACSTYKWMLGPYGYAFGYYSPRAQKLIHHQTGNWITSIHSQNVYDLLNYTTQTLEGARKYDRGQSPNMLTMACLKGSLSLFLECGLDKIEEYNSYLRKTFLDLLPKKKFEVLTPREACAGIVALKTKNLDHSLRIEKKLKEANIDVSVRQGNMRLSFHFFNNLEQIEYLIKTLESVN